MTDQNGSVGRKGDEMFYVKFKKKTNLQKKVNNKKDLKLYREEGDQ